MGSEVDCDLFLAKLHSIISNKREDNWFYFPQERYSKVLSEVISAKVKCNSPLDYRRLRRFDVLRINDDELRLIVPVKPGDTNVQYYVTNDELFSILSATHTRLGHGGRMQMLRELQTEYKNTTYEVVMLYLNLCEKCQLKHCAPKRAFSAAGLWLKPKIVFKDSETLNDILNNTNNKIYNNTGTDIVKYTLNNIEENMDIKVTEEEEIATIDSKLNQIERELIKLRDKKEVLMQRKEKLKQQILKRKSEELATRDWSSRKFPWSKKVDSTLREVFKLTEFRPMQLEAINATLAKEDAILIMPTGSGKSLCYQLPALIDNGITLVVSPLVSLMEDQVMALKRINYPALMLSANSTKEDVKNAINALQDSNSKIKLIYVTPEKLAKSKRFMSQLQKCDSQGRFSRLAIDEVHCCSVWGHDFRPDYNYLGILKDMFPRTPLLGLTATSTSKVTLDVQKMLNIQGCLVLKSSFNRPNLFYEVMLKPPTQNECLDLLEDWLKNRFKDQTGIIYSTAIKDCEEIAKELKKRGIKVGLYHAMLDAEVRTKMHMKWMDGSLQVIVATIAFGLGIDKPDVRFIIHHSLSKSMENFYQESGRAGRDGKRSQCIVMFRLADVFKLSTMVFTQQTGLENLYGMLNYCLDAYNCRRSLIAQHFDEVWEPEACNKMCDHCKNPAGIREFDATEHCRSLRRIIQNALGLDTKLTVIKLVDAWYGKGDAKLRVSDVKRPTFDRTTAEKIVGYLLIKGYLKEDFHYTAYSTISYLRGGPKYALLDDPEHRIMLVFRGASSTTTLSDTSGPKKIKIEATNEGRKSQSRCDGFDDEKNFYVVSSDDEVEVIKDGSSKRKSNGSASATKKKSKSIRD